MRPPLHPSLRYRTYSSVLRDRFGGPVYRIPVDGGFTCPNRDGTAGSGGCLYCNNDSFTPGILHPGLPVAEQVRWGLSGAGRRRAGARFLVYFQRFSNTYGPAQRLARLYREALSHPSVVGLVVGTRPDCLPPDVLDVLEAIARDRYVCVEIGLQSLSDRVLARIRRGHTVADFVRAARAAGSRGLSVAAHLIYGLPGDSREQFSAAAPFLSSLGVSGVKLHHLHVVEGSGLAAAWRSGEVAVPEYGEYIGAVADFLERLSPDVAVMRLVGEAPDRILLAPRWGKGSREVSRDIAAELARRGSWQGSREGKNGGTDPGTVEVGRNG